jgi:NAD(P)H-dependent FMN reductase
VRILALSGSLRADSSNARLLRTAAALAPEGMRITFYEGVRALPHFDPDLDVEGATPPAAVADWRAALAAADGVVISSPEYAHGVPGSLKNALDWIVSSGELTDKPLALLTAAPGGGGFAHAALAETLGIMGARLLPEASLQTSAARNEADPELERRLSVCLTALAAAIADADPASNARS